MTTTETKNQATKPADNGERLILRKTLKDGRVLAVNTWATGWQELVYPSMAAFERGKAQIEQQGIIPAPLGFADI
jgi:hypothetical protein